MYSNLSSIGIIGGGPAALMFIKHLLKKEVLPKTIYIFEKNNRLGVGMPYGKHGACEEHVANISANELPSLLDSFEDFYKEYRKKHHTTFSDTEIINPYKVIPRLILGDYLEHQFIKYVKLAKRMGIKMIIYKSTAVTDITESKEKNKYIISTDYYREVMVDLLIICTGHSWSKNIESKKKGWYDSPYPPSKFTEVTNCPVAIRGTSLTAVDAIKTLSRLNGYFEDCRGKITYHLNKGSENFKINLFSTGGFLPSLRFHSEEDSFSKEWTMTLDEIFAYKNDHSGFVDLDYVFEINYKKPIKDKDPKFYDEIKSLTIEEFSQKMLQERSEHDSFELMKEEYQEAAKSIENKKSIPWKEKLSSFSYAMNYPAKHFSAEDMLRLKRSLMPLISVIIASLPQCSYREIIALYEAQIISLTQVDHNSKVEPHDIVGGIYNYKNILGESMSEHYNVFIDAIGQKQLNIDDFPFDGLKESNKVSQGFLSFLDNNKAESYIEENKEKIIKGYNHNYYLQVPGLAINDHFQTLNKYNQSIDNIYIMAVPFIGGLNPDYSGLDFCDTAASRIIDNL